MDDANKDLTELLSKLKTMRPEDSGADAPEPAKESAPASVAGKTEKKPKAAKKPATGAESAITGNIYKKIEAIEADIREKEGVIDVDLKKLDDLVKALGQREAELTAKESELAEKDTRMSKELEDLKRVREELQKVLH